MHAVAGDGEHGAGGGIGRKRRIGWPSIVSLGLDRGFRFIWKPAQSNCLPTQPPHSYALPLYLTVGKMGFRKTGQSKIGGTPGSVCAGSLRAGLCRPGFELIKNIFHKPPKFGLTAPFLRGCPPREMRAPPGRCPPCPTLSQSKRCVVSSCTRLWRPRGRPAARPTCGVHAVRCLGSLFLGETGGFLAK
jgi:hypothetical protein